MKFLVLVGIEHDILKRRHEPGEIADLSDWPAEVIEIWLEQGVIAPARIGEHDRTES